MADGPDTGSHSEVGSEVCFLRVNSEYTYDGDGQAKVAHCYEEIPDDADLSALGVAIIGVCQSFNLKDSLGSMQVHGACRLRDDANRVIDGMLGVGLPTEEEVVAGVRAARKQARKKDDFPRDSAAKMEHAFAKHVSSAMPPDIEGIRSEAKRLIAQSKARGESFQTTLSQFGVNPESVRETLESTRIVDVFPAAQITGGFEGVLSGIRSRGGRPKLIIIFGHGNGLAVSSHYEDHIPLSAERLVAGIPSIGEDQTVYLMACSSFDLAVKCDRLTPDDRDGQILWLGNVVPTPQINVFAGDRACAPLVVHFAVAKFFSLCEIPYLTYSLASPCEGGWYSGKFEDGCPRRGRMWQLVLLVLADERDAVDLRKAPLSASHEKEFADFASDDNPGIYNSVKAAVQQLRDADRLGQQLTQPHRIWEYVYTDERRLEREARDAARAEYDDGGATTSTAMTDMEPDCTSEPASSDSAAGDANADEEQAIAQADTETAGGSVASGSSGVDGGD